MGKCSAALAATAAILAGCILASPAVASVNPAFAPGPDGPLANPLLPTQVLATERPCVGDFNGDGNLDIALATVANSPPAGGVYVSYGDGTGHFGAWHSVMSTSADPRCAVGDLNGDGRSDLAVVDRGASGLTILFGQANNTFTQSSISTGSKGGDAAIGDFDGDHHRDVAVGMDTSSTTGELDIFYGDGRGAFTPGTSQPYGSGSLPPANDLVSADVNNDGHSDLLVSGVSTGDLWVVLGGSQTAPGNLIPQAFPTTDMAVADLNGDGKPDIFFTAGALYGQVALGGGTGHFALQSDQYPQSASPLDLAASASLADLNNDGAVDGVLGDGDRADGATDLWTVTGAPQASQPFFSQTTVGPITASSSIALNVEAVMPADVNNDGRVDLVAVANSGSKGSGSGLAILLNTTPVPAVATGPATNVGGDDATVTGTVGDGGGGLSTSYGVDLVAANGNFSREPAAGTLSGAGNSVSIPLKGLSPQTTYTYRVYATNVDGTTVGQEKTFTTTVAAPANTSPPQISGTAQSGNSLTCQAGAWSGSPTFSYQWLRGGVALTGQTNPSYIVVDADAGSPLSCQVTGVNAGGSASASSPSVVAILSSGAGTLIRPQNLGSPHVVDLSAPGSVTPKVGHALACAAGTWNAGGTFTYAWLRNGKPIGGANNAGYVVRNADAGQKIACEVTVNNAAGSASAASRLLQVAVLSCLVPNVRGETLAAAKRTLKAANCRAGAVSKRLGFSVAPRHVLKTVPARGHRLPGGASVKIVLEL